MFSIIIPLYNKEKFIRETVESALSQDLKDFEIIVVNDGSNDKSISKIEDISDNRLKIVNQANQGVGAARNTGMSHANFGWLALLDGDDLWAPNHLSELRKIIEKFPLSGMVATSYKPFYSNTEFKVDNIKSKTHIRSIDYFLEPTVWTSATAIKKDVFKNLGGFTDTKRGEDLEYWVRIALSYSVATSDKVTAYYRQNTGGITDTEVEALGEDYFVEIKSLSDISPSIELLVKKSKEDADIFKNPSIKKYINERLLAGMRGWLLEEDNIEMARQLAKFGRPDFSKAFLIFVATRVVPKLAIKRAITTYKKIRRLRV